MPQRDPHYTLCSMAFLNTPGNTVLALPLLQGSAAAMRRCRMYDWLRVGTAIEWQSNKVHLTVFYLFSWRPRNRLNTQLCLQ